MSYSLIVLPAVAEHLQEALREREERETRRAVLAEIAATFHFAVFFEIVEARAEVVIVGVLHQRRDPAGWPGR